MKVDIVSKGTVYIHMLIVALMAMAGLPQIVIYTSLLWGVCCYMSIPFCEEQYYLELPRIRIYRHFAGFAVIFVIFFEYFADNSIKKLIKNCGYENLFLYLQKNNKNLKTCIYL